MMVSITDIIARELRVVRYIYTSIHIYIYISNKRKSESMNYINFAFIIINKVIKKYYVHSKSSSHQLSEYTYFSPLPAQQEYLFFSPISSVCSLGTPISLPL